ncbi:MAG: hypothetical protein N3B10_14605 [Armatimonadetes bacterium]|nr:hypothetical protein [Armatimonadota bacterium]MCX7969702.1 hypothetical protein [Armatimonadota bacterium]MDW8144441.1 hypothetical protein [Armatimonadota bacterium]
MSPISGSAEASLPCLYILSAQNTIRVRSKDRVTDKISARCKALPYNFDSLIAEHGAKSHR